MGIRAAKGERILLCDADDVVSTGWVREMGEALRSFDVVGGAMDYESLNDSLVQLTMQHVQSTELPISRNHLGYAVGANLGFRRSVFDAIGGFDESFLYGSDDIDFCWRAQYEGFLLGFVPRALVQYRLRHRLGARAKQCFAYANGNALLCAKHRALGRLHLTRADQAKSATLPLKSLVRVYWLTERQHRWLYVRHAATAAGSIWGLVHFDLVPRDTRSSGSAAAQDVTPVAEVSYTHISAQDDASPGRSDAWEQRSGRLQACSAKEGTRYDESPLDLTQISSSVPVSWSIAVTHRRLETSSP
jgi:hypothetical protein